MKLDAIAQGLLGGIFAIRVLDTSKPMWARVGFGLVAADCFMDLWKGAALSTGPVLAGGGVAAAERLAGANGDLGRVNLPTANVDGKPLQFAPHRANSIQERVAYVHQQMIQGTKDPKVYTLARKIVGAQNADGSWKVPEKDNTAEVVALFNEVRKKVRYTWDPTDYDAFQTPAKTLALHTGDCDDYSSLLGAMIRSIGIPVRTRIVQTKDSDTWNHIYLVVQINGQWMPLDASMAKPAFWEVPKGIIVAQQDFDVVE